MRHQDLAQLSRHGTCHLYLASLSQDLTPRVVQCQNHSHEKEQGQTEMNQRNKDLYNIHMFEVMDIGDFKTSMNCTV